MKRAVRLGIIAGPLVVFTARLVVSEQPVLFFAFIILFYMTGLVGGMAVVAGTCTRLIENPSRWKAFAGIIAMAVCCLSAIWFITDWYRRPTLVRDGIALGLMMGTVPLVVAAVARVLFKQTGSKARAAVSGTLVALLAQFLVLWLAASLLDFYFEGP